MMRAASAGLVYRQLLTASTGLFSDVPSGYSRFS